MNNPEGEESADALRLGHAADRRSVFVLDAHRARGDGGKMPPPPGRGGHHADGGGGGGPMLVDDDEEEEEDELEAKSGLRAGVPPGPLRSPKPQEGSQDGPFDDINLLDYVS